MRLPHDFKEFLQLLRSEKIEYLVIGGYAVAFHGYPRSTGDMDIWVAMHERNANGLVAALEQFGFSKDSLSPQLFLRPNQIIRMGVPPLRIELLTGISGVDFATCYSRRISSVVDGIDVDFISLRDLRVNKQAAGRFKDLNDLEHLP